MNTNKKNMKKFNSKQKIVKSNHKISSFFIKTSNKSTPEKAQNDDIDVIPATPSVLTKQSRILQTLTYKDDSNKRKIIDSSDNNITSNHAMGSPPRKKKFSGDRKNADYSIPSTSKSICSPICSTSIIKNVTPEKRFKKLSPNSPGKKTPNRIKSPRKLFCSTTPAIDFNVEVIENLVKITPSKSSLEFEKISPPKSSTKKQSSILKYISPSPNSKQAQMQNEGTPEKSSLNTMETLSFSKARINLSVKFTNTLSNCAEILSCNNDVPIKHMNEAVDLLDIDDGWENCDIQYYLLDLSIPQHCSVIEYVKDNNGVVITVESTKTGDRAKCRLEGFWVWSKINVGCTLYITAIKDSHVWKITNEEGLLVYEPDILISNTAVVGALFCKRRSVLKEKFLGFESENKVMVIGVLIHTLLQGVLKIKTANAQKIENMLDDILSTRSTVKMLHNISLKLEELKTELVQFIPRTVKFMEDYVLRRSNTKHDGNNWKGRIDDVKDIEENLWCPHLGIKGKVDVSILCEKNIMPLELKTGRARVSLEHRGQVMLYILMMSKLGYKVSSGLLLYLREGVLQEVSYSDKEKRDLILLRNELTYFLTRKVQVNDNNEKYTKDMSWNEKLSALQVPELPEPIDHSACEKCPYNIICCSYLRYEKADLTNYKILNNIKEDNLSHLNDLHIEYFVHFSNLLDLEGYEKKGKHISVIYTKTPQERESFGKTITFVKVIKNVTEYDGLYEHTFERVDSCSSNNSSFFTSGIGDNSYVIISSCQRPAISSGIVNSVNHKTITIVLDRNLKTLYPNTLFHIDSYDSNNVFGFNFTSLSLLLEPTTQGKRLRELIVEKKPPTFKLKLSKMIASKGPPILKRLNKAQQRAVLKACSANDYLLIKGMPGAGKTATIVALVELLVQLGESILITSHTHAAVDNMCIRLKKCGIRVLRLGSIGRIHPDIQSMSEYELTKRCKTPEELEDIYSNAKVIAVTCLGTKHPIFNKRTLDVCIVDESTQVIQCSLFRPISTSKKFILIGDPDQLTPVVRNIDATKYGLSESLFERLENPEATVTLNVNYRMNITITQLANALTYKGELQVANDTIANATMKISNFHNFLTEYNTKRWLTETLDESLNNAVKVLDTGPVWEKIKNNIENSDEFNVNTFEIGIVKYLVTALLKGGLSSKSIGIISPYVAQVSQLSLALREHSVDINTVDQFQGRDKDIIIFSCALSRNIQAHNINPYHILEDKRRLNVAITRAKHKLILICDLATISNFSPFKKLLAHLPQHCFIRLKDGEDGFNWETVHL